MTSEKQTLRKNLLRLNKEQLVNIITSIEEANRAYIDRLENLEKDLEVLKIIKKNITYHQNSGNFFGTRVSWVIALSLNIDEYEYIQEWVKDGRKETV